MSENQIDEHTTRLLDTIESAKFDKALLEELNKSGYSQDQLEKLADELMRGVLDDHLTCKEIRNILRRHFKSKKPRARKLVMGYRKELVKWLGQNNNLPHPPQLTLQQLPPIDSDTFSQYIDQLLELKRRMADQTTQLFPHLRQETENHSLTDAINSAESIEASGKLMKELQRDNEQAAIEMEFGIVSPCKNVVHVLAEFISQSEENALLVFLRILDTQSEVDLADFDDLTTACLSRLANNTHFVRSLIHLIDQNLFDRNPAKQIQFILLFQLMRRLIDTEIADTWQGQEPAVDFSQPRNSSILTYHLHNEGADDESPNRDFNINLRIPAQHLPAHWNNHRLVNPSSNEEFQDMAQLLDQQQIELRDTESEIYTNALRHHRCYALDFARMKITEIPETENKEIWFHFFHHHEMTDGEIGVEVIVDGASIVYFITNDAIEMRGTGNYLPRGGRGLQSLEVNNQLDQRYGEPALRQWASPHAIQNLHYYMLKYAHALLVEPRSITESSHDSQHHDLTNNRFGIRLSEYSSEVTIPSVSAESQSSNQLSRRVTVYHGVSGHIRNLRAGHRASPEAVTEAQRQNIFLTPGQTYVQPHTRGTELAEKIDSDKKVRS